MLDRPNLMLKRRTFLALLGMVGFSALLTGRVIYIQGPWAKKLRQLARQSHLRGVPLAPLRGEIVDRAGRVLAESYHQYSLYAVPIQIRERETESTLLSTLLNIPEAKLKRKFSRRLGFVWIKRRLTPQQLELVRSQSGALPGVYLAPESARAYPQGDFAGPVLGFTGIDNQGLAGLEYTYNKYLKGRRGWILREYDVAGQPIPGKPSHLDAPVPGDKLVTTLDENIQWMAERAAEEARLQHGARRVMIALMDPSSGGLLALASRPGFNPNDFRNADPKLYRNYLVSDAIPPGSIFKPVTLAAALAAGVASVDTGFWCPGFKIVLGRRVNCWRREGHGAETLSDVVKNSCNVGFMELGLALGRERFYEAVKNFRAVGPTGIDLPGEGRGILPAQRKATALDLAVMAFGQTLTTTPIALLNAVAALANGGELLIPHVGEKIVTPTGHTVLSLHRRLVRRVVPSEVSQLVQNMMERVVREGTGKLARVPGYRVAGKTGTAQKVVAGRVAENVYISSFIGFAPVGQPRVAIICSVDEPQGAYYGGQVSAPVVGRLLKQVLQYLQVQPTEAVKPPSPGEQVIVPNLVNLDPLEARQDAALYGFSVQFRGHGPVVVDQSVVYGGYRPAGTPLILTLGQHTRIYQEWVAVPNLVGLPVSAARQVAFDIGINLHVEGNMDGRVRWQEWTVDREVRAGLTMPVRAE